MNDKRNSTSENRGIVDVAREVSTAWNRRFCMHVSESPCSVGRSMVKLTVSDPRGPSGEVRDQRSINLDFV